MRQQLCKTRVGSDRNGLFLANHDFAHGVPSFVETGVVVCRTRQYVENLAPAYGSGR